ncbi:MAG: hypothetical protein NVS4B2_06820 [Chloroflexota bacterium]
MNPVPNDDTGGQIWERALQELDHVETEELDGDRSVQFEFGRRWPKYVVTWSIRQRAGDSDFPVANGEITSMPPATGDDLESLWNDLRQRAHAEACEAGAASGANAGRSRSFFDRLLGRR